MERIDPNEEYSLAVTLGGEPVQVYTDTDSLIIASDDFPEDEDELDDMEIVPVDSFELGEFKDMLFSRRIRVFRTYGDYQAGRMYATGVYPTYDHQNHVIHVDVVRR